MSWWWWSSGLTLLYDSQSSPTGGQAGQATACSDLAIYMNGGEPPYTLQGYYYSNQNWSDITGFRLTKGYTDNVYMYTVAAPIHSSLFFTLTDNTNTTITGTRVLNVISNEKGRSADTWCQYNAAGLAHPVAPTNGSKLSFNDTDSDGVDGYGNSSTWPNKGDGDADDIGYGYTSTIVTKTKTSIAPDDESDHMPTSATSFISDLESRSHIVESALGSLVAITFTACVALLWLLLRFRKRYKRMEASIALTRSPSGGHDFNPSMKLRAIVTEKPGLLSGFRKKTDGEDLPPPAHRGGKNGLPAFWRRGTSDAPRQTGEVDLARTPLASDALRNPFDDANAPMPTPRSHHLGLLPASQRLSRTSFASSNGDASSQGGYVSSSNTTTSNPHSAYSTEHYHRTKASTMIHPHNPIPAPLAPVHVPQSDNSVFTSSSSSGGEMSSLSSEANTVIVPISRVSTNQSTTSFDSSRSGATSLLPASSRDPYSDEGEGYGARRSETDSRRSYPSSMNNSAEDLRYGTSFWSEDGGRPEEGGDLTETEGEPTQLAARKGSSEGQRSSNESSRTGRKNPSAAIDPERRRTPHFWQ